MGLWDSLLSTGYSDLDVLLEEERVEYMVTYMETFTFISVLWAIVTTLLTIYFAHKTRLLGMSSIIPRFGIIYKRRTLLDKDLAIHRKDGMKYGTIQDYLVFVETNGKEVYRLEYEYWVKQRDSSKIIKNRFSNVAGRTFIPKSQVDDYRIIPLLLTDDELLKVDNVTVEKIMWRIWYSDAGEKFQFCLCSVFERDNAHPDGWKKISADFHVKGLVPIIRCKAKKELKRK